MGWWDGEKGASEVGVAGAGGRSRCEEHGVGGVGVAGRRLGVDHWLHHIQPAAGAWPGPQGREGWGGAVAKANVVGVCGYLFSVSSSCRGMSWTTDKTPNKTWMGVFEHCVRGKKNSEIPFYEA